jgi:hypothetical protein
MSKKTGVSKKMAFRETNLEETPLDPEMAGNLKENRQWVKILNEGIHYGGSALREIPDTIKRVIRKGMWRRYLLGIVVVEFDTFEDFVTTKAPYGLDATVEQIIKLCDGDTEAQRMIEGELKRGPGAPLGNTNNRYSSKEEDTIVNNVNSCIERPMGNSKRAGIRKLEKDRPDLLEEVEAGKMSIHNAMVEAGFRKQTWTAPGDFEELAVAIKKRYPANQLCRMVELLQEAAHA